MWTCPVCNQISETRLCPQCGFDGSRHYEAFPTLAELSSAQDAVSRLRSNYGIRRSDPPCPICGRFSASALCGCCGFDSGNDVERYPTLENLPGLFPARSRRRTELALKDMRTLQCQNCGGTSFSWAFDRAEPVWGCIACGAAMPHAQLEAQRKRFARTQTSCVQNPKRFIAAGARHGAVLRTNGTVYAFGEEDSGQCKTQDWEGIVAVAAGSLHTVGLRFDGTVVAAGSDSAKQCRVSDWRDIVAIAAGPYHTAGLRSDGTVVVTGVDYGQNKVEAMSQIVAVNAGKSFTAGIRADGTVQTTNPEDEAPVGQWKDIVDIVHLAGHTLGLRGSGSVAVHERSSNRFHSYTNLMSYWQDLTDIAAGLDFVAGLRKHGAIVLLGEGTHYIRSANTWSEIIAIAAGSRFLMGLKKDGTVLVAGELDVQNLSIIR